MGFLDRALEGRAQQHRGHTMLETEDALGGLDDAGGDFQAGPG